MQFYDITQETKQTYTITKSDRYVYYFHNISRDITWDIRSKNAEVYIFGLITGNGDESFTLNLQQKHTTPNATSHCTIRSVLQDGAKLFCKDTIHIGESASKTRAQFDNQNSLLSDKASVDTRPYLEIENNDVTCSHKATTSRPSQDHIDYLQLRGLSQEESEQLLIDGFIQSLFQEMEKVGVEKEKIESLQRDLCSSFS